MAQVTVPDVIGLGRGAAEAKLDALLLRHIAHFIVGAGTGLATNQSPAAGTPVDDYSVVTVSYLTPLFAPDSPIEGPSPEGIFTGHITGIKVDGTGAWISFVPDSSTSQIWALQLYADAPDLILPRTDWMRRGAMLGVAERAFTNSNHVSLATTNGLMQSLELVKP